MFVDCPTDLIYPRRKEEGGDGGRHWDTNLFKFSSWRGELAQGSEVPELGSSVSCSGRAGQGELGGALLTVTLHPDSPLCEGCAQ